MNTYITLSCLLAVVATGHGYALGYGGGWGGLGWGGYGLNSVQIIKTPILAPAISTQNLYKAAPIPIIKSVAVAPIVSAPILKTVPVSTWGAGSLGYGLNSYGLGYDGYGLGGGLGYGKGLWIK